MMAWILGWVDDIQFGYMRTIDPEMRILPEYMIETLGIVRAEGSTEKFVMAWIDCEVTDLVPEEDI